MNPVSLPDCSANSSRSRLIIFCKACAGPVRSVAVRMSPMFFGNPSVRNLSARGGRFTVTLVTLGPSSSKNLSISMRLAKRLPGYSPGRLLSFKYLLYASVASIVQFLCADRMAAFTSSSLRAELANAFNLCKANADPRRPCIICLTIAAAIWACSAASSFPLRVRASANSFSSRSSSVCTSPGCSSNSDRLWNSVISSVSRVSTLSFPPLSGDNTIRSPSTLLTTYIALSLTFFQY